MSKMYGSYSDEDLNDWERFPLSANVLTSSAFGAWLMRRDERRDKCKLEQIKNRLEKMPFYFGTTFHGQTIKTVDVEKVIEMLDEAIKEQTNDRDN